MANSEVIKRPALIHSRYWWFVVAYAIFDVGRTWLRTQQFVADAVASGISLIRTPLDMMGDSLLFLAASLSTRFAKPWGYLAAVVFSFWLLYRGFEKWSSIASAIDQPRFSIAVISYWFSYGDGGFDFARLLLAITILVYSIIASIRFGQD